MQREGIFREMKFAAITKTIERKVRERAEAIRRARKACAQSDCSARAVADDAEADTGPGAARSGRRAHPGSAENVRV